MHKHLRLTCYALLCLLVPIGVMAQTEHTYLDRALPGSWSEEGSDFQQTLPVEDNWWRNFKDPLLDSLIEVAVKQNYSVQMAMDRIAMAESQPAVGTRKLLAHPRAFRRMDTATK